MTVYIYKDGECIDSYELPTCSFDDLIENEHWNDFARYLFNRSYLRPEYSIEFK